MRFKAETLLEKGIVPIFETAKEQETLVRMLFGHTGMKENLDTLSFKISQAIDRRAFLLDEDINSSISYWRDKLEGATKYATVMLLQDKTNKSLVEILNSNEDLDEISGTGHWCLQEEDFVAFYDDLYSCLRDTTEAQEGMISSIDNLYRDFKNKEIENFAIKVSFSNKDFSSLKNFIDEARKNINNHSHTK